MLSFITGSPKSGKTQKIIEAISSDLSRSRRVLLLVPEQEAVSAERRIIASLGSSDAVFSLEVANFRRLSNIVFRQEGGLCYNYIDKGGQALIMWRVLCELSPELSVFKKDESADIGLISSLVSLYSQLADYRVTPEKLERASAELSESHRAKAEDIALLYTRYDYLIHDGFDSANDDLIKVAELIRSKKLFSDTSVYIDSFTGFTPSELEVLKAMLSVGCDVTVSLCIDKERDSELFENLQEVKNELSDCVESFEEIFCPSPKRSDEFAHVAKYIFDCASSECYIEPTRDITLSLAPDVYSECEMVIADIVKHIKAGMRYRDITVVCQNAADYYGILDVMLKRHDIPCRFSITNDVLQTRCLKYIISALNVLIYNWRSNDVITYIKTGFCPISDEEAELLEEYVSTWSLEGKLWTMEEPWSMNPEGYTSRMTSRSASVLERVNNIRDRIREPLLELREALVFDRSAEKSAEALYKFLITTIDTKTLIGDEIASWNALISSLEQLSLCLGKEKINDLETLKRLIRLVASQISFSLLPASADEISCVSASSLRSCDAKRIYLIGANEGCFPGESKESNIIDDRMRKALCDKGLTMPHDPDELYREENHLFYKILLSAPEGVMISRPTSSLDGTEKVASGSIGELMRIFSSLTTVSYKELSVYDLIYDKVSAYDRINDSDRSCNTYLQRILHDDEYARSLSDSSVPLSTFECSVSDERCLEAYKGDMPLSQTRIERFVGCSFAYQLQYNLKLKEQLKVEFDNRDTGNFVHKVLEDYFTRTKDMGKLSKQEREGIVDEIVDSYIKAIFPDRNNISKRLLAFFDKLRRNSHIFVQDIFEEFEDSSFEPKFFEMKISDKDNEALSPYMIELSDGSSVYINGMIDRVDAFEKNGNVYFRVVDYKTGKKEFDVRELAQGINLQMFLYLFSIMENKEKFLELLSMKGDLVPAGVIYYMARLTLASYDSMRESEELERDVISAIGRKGMLLADEEVINATSLSKQARMLPGKIDLKNEKGAVYTYETLGAIREDIENAVKRVAEGIKSGKADADPNPKLRPCDYCNFADVCRRKALGGEEDE